MRETACGEPRSNRAQTFRRSFGTARIIWDRAKGSSELKMTMAVVYSNFCGMVVSETRNGVESDYISDPLGSNIGLMNSAGAMTDRWEYWPFGEVVSRTGTSVTPLTFLGVIGYFKDQLDKLFYVRARHLRVDLARWLTVDPLWPSQTSYCYAQNNPVAKSDPSGLWPWDDCGYFNWANPGICSQSQYDQCAESCGNNCSPLVACVKPPFTCNSTCICGTPASPCNSNGVAGNQPGCLGDCLAAWASQCDSYSGQLLFTCLAFVAGLCAFICGVLGISSVVSSQK